MSETSLAIIQSQFFSINFLFAFLFRSFVSAANPITSLGRRELCFEGHRIYDLTRKGQSLQRGDDYWDAQSVTFPNELFVYPIPDAETDINPNIEQNPGY